MPRVGSSKSRKGCTRCKLRKVKCDEARPSCTWCKAHSLPCEYTGLPAAQERLRTFHSSLSPASAISRGRSSIGSPVSVGESRTIDNVFALELALMQYYIATVAPTFPAIESAKAQAWRIHADLIPQEALKCPSLLHAMYAYALLHIHIEAKVNGRLPRNRDYFESIGVRVALSSNFGSAEQTPESVTFAATDVLTLHRRYLGSALQKQQEAISNICAANADGLCLASILIASISLIHDSQTDPCHEEYVLPLEWFYLQRSFTPCLEAARPFLGIDSATTNLIFSPPAVDNQNLPPAREDGPFWYLASWNPPDETEDMSVDEEAGYLRSIAYLQALYKYVMQGEALSALGRRVLAFPSVASEDFIRTIEESRPRALVLLAHVLCFSERVDRLWWVFKGVANHHVRGIALSLPTAWQCTLEWPLKAVEKGVNRIKKPP